MSDRLARNLARMALAARRMDARAAEAEEAFVSIGTVAQRIVERVDLRRSGVETFTVLGFLAELRRRMR